MVLVLLLIVGGLATIGSLIQEDEPANRAVPRSESPTKGMNKAESALYGVAGFAECDPLRASSLPRGASAGIRCDASNTRFKNGELVPFGTRMSADIFRYPTKRAAADAYWARLDRLRAPGSGAAVASEAGWCVQTGAFPSLYGCGTTDGRVAFYRKAGHTFALWTEPHRVLAVAERFDGKLEKLSTIWWDRW